MITKEKKTTLYICSKVNKSNKSEVSTLLTSTDLTFNNLWPHKAHFIKLRSSLYHFPWLSLVTCTTSYPEDICVSFPELVSLIFYIYFSHKQLISANYRVKHGNVKVAVFFLYSMSLTITKDLLFPFFY